MPDSAIAAATLVYFSGVHSRYRLPVSLERMLSPFCTKAFLVGTLFTAGCLLPVWSQLRATGAPISHGRLLIAPALFFAVLGWLNCHAIAQWESARPDTAVHGLTSITLVAAFAGLLLAVFVAFIEPRPAILIAFGSASAFLLALLDWLRTRLTSLALRAAADLVLLSPAMLIAFEYAAR